MIFFSFEARDVSNSCVTCLFYLTLEKHTNGKMKKHIYSLFKRVPKAMKRPFLCKRNKVESIVPVSEPALTPHHSSGFESASLSSTPDNLSKTSSSLSEDSVDEREGNCSMRANRRHSLHTFNITKQDMWDQDGISSIPEYMYTLPGEVPVSVPSVILSAQGATDASPVENSTTGETDIQLNSN